MKFEEFVLEKTNQETMNVFATIPFVNRKDVMPDYHALLSDEENEAVAKVEEKIYRNRQGVDSRISKYNVLRQGMESIDRRIAIDEEAITSMVARQGLIKEYTDNMKQIDLGNLEQAMMEVHQDKMLEKYHYFIGEV